MCAEEGWYLVTSSRSRGDEMVVVRKGLIESLDIAKGGLEFFALT